ncbi:choline/carnitine O-acyltransferase [Actinokineospora soli]
MSTEALSQRTFGNEDRLPRVPLPTLEESCARFLRWCAPLLTPDELAETEETVAAFLAPDSPARALHAELEKYDASEGVRSYLDLFWPSRYLGRRDRIALNANFFFLFEDVDDTEDPQIARAVALVSAAVDYKLALDAEAVPPVVVRGQPQSMEQQKFLFSTTRIPGEVQDTVRAPYGHGWDGPSPARHIAVLFRGAVFALDVLSPEGKPYTPHALAAALRAITADAVRPASPVGHLTTKARAEWAASRAALRALPGNAEALESIESALFCLCLEDFAAADTQGACDQLLHGDSGNRWFDKAVSLIVFADGRAGINVEHCGLDGTTILAFTDALLRPVLPRSTEFADGEPAHVPVEFTVDEALRADIAAAATAFAEYAADTATQIVSFPAFGSDAIKSLGMSPDAFVQMAYQVAHKRSKGVTGATYESIATRQFQNGRTEAMRVVTPEVLAFLTVLEDGSSTPEARRDAFRTAASAHVARAKECQAGLAPEQHLWELDWIQRRRGEDATLPLYRSPGWLVMRDDYLSTSSAPSTTIQYFGFGSTSKQCIGVAYVLLPDRFNVYLSTPSSVAEEMHKFADHLRAAVAELGALLAE